MTNAYVTNATLRKISRAFMTKNVGIQEILDSIFKEDLREILNDREIMVLYVQNLMVQMNFENLVFDSKFMDSHYIFDVGPPAYHMNETCEKLHADFVNYAVPFEIRDLGSDKVQEFKQYCRKYQSELYGDAPDVFWAKAGAAFGVQIRPHQIKYENSGSTLLDESSAEDVTVTISRQLKSALDMLENEETGKVIRNLRYAPSGKRASKYADDDAAQNALADFFNLKMDIAGRLFQLFKIQSGVEENSVPLEVLDIAGVKPCRNCCVKQFAPNARANQTSTA